MTFLQNTTIASVQSLRSFEIVTTESVQPVVIDNASPYNDETVAKILAAKRGQNADAPTDPDKFLDWLTA